MTTRRKLLAAVMGVGFALSFQTPTHALGAEDSSPPKATHKAFSDATWARLFDESIPIAERQTMLAKLEEDAGQADSHELYLLGSLYHMGRHAPGSPAQADADRAGLYLANAAVRGSVLAMAKMAEIKLDTHQYREAMNWAQIYAYYALRQPMKNEGDESYGAELVLRAKQNVERSEMDAIMKDVTSFVAANDAAIRAGLKASAAGPRYQPSTKRRFIETSPLERAPDAGIVDFVIGFRADGTAAKVLLIDAVPRQDLADTLRASADNMTLPADTNQDKALRYVWVPLVLSDRRYAVRNRN